MTGLQLLAAAFLTLALLVALTFFALKRRNIDTWIVSYLRREWKEPRNPDAVCHVIFCFVDHFEPRWERPSYDVECARVARWVRDYPVVCAAHRDADGHPPVHTFFYPEEEYRPEHIDELLKLCRQGLGEIEVHLHHDRDTASAMRARLREFTKALAHRHSALPADTDSGAPRWAFIHGNWALDNSRPDGRWCGVPDELRLLREEGCYADFTLPSAPDPTQTRTINSIYYATGNPGKSKAHDTGVAVRVGGRATGDLLIVQGPLGFQWNNRKFGVIPRIENGDVRAGSPPDVRRADHWVRTGIHVRGRPEWVFVKVHTHGAKERDMDTLLGAPLADLFSYLEGAYNDGSRYKLHYVSARELFNLVKAAESGVQGEPGQYRDFILPRPSYGVHGAY
jgi:hypothetical protein